MLRNYFKIMVRNVLKRKGFALINLLGLAIGMAICVLLALYIENELGFDNYQERGDQMYRLAIERKYPGRTAIWGGISPSIGQAVKMEFPEVLESTRALDFGYNGVKINIGEKMFTEKKVLMADSNFFRVFTGKFLGGDVNTALQKPGTAVLSERTANRYFGTIENAIGKQIIVNETRKCIISGVCRDWPYKSHFQFNVLISTSGMEEFNGHDYVESGPYTYLLLDKNAHAKSLEAKLPLIVEKYVAGSIEQTYGQTYKQFMAEGNGIRYFLQPLKKIHLTSDLEDELQPGGSMGALFLLGAIAALILFLGCINFINLSTALSVERAREIGIRKTFGASKAELIWQFLAESVLFSLSSMIVALGLVLLLIPMVNNISGINLTFTYFLQPLPLLMVICFSIFVGIMAGLYPAFVLSSFDPIMVLKGSFKSTRRGIVLRNGLVVFQFAVSVILIICTIVVNRQMQYMLADQFGIKEDHIITLEGLWQISSRQSFVDEIARIPGVGDISKCTDLPFNDEGGGVSTWVALDNKATRTQKVIKVDDRYLKLLNLHLKEGRFFSNEFTTDSLGIILNETAVKDFSLKNPIGTRLISKESYANPNDGKTQCVFTVIGVVKDFHYQSLRKKIEPLIFTNSNKFGWGEVGIRIKGNHFKNTISEIEKRLKKFDAKHDFQFGFLDQTRADLYKAEQTEQKIFKTFSLLAILIACVGLFGLAAYSTHQRAKEISIRKVLGAMPGNIIMILSRDFLIPVIMASLIAFPLAWWAMYKWLQNFAYRIDISWWVFLLAGFIAVMIATLTISYQAINAALANPVKSLKSE